MTREDEEEDEEEEDEEEDEEEEDEEEEDDGLTLDDVKDVADTASSVFKAVKAFKDISDDSKSKGYHETSTPRPPAPEERKAGWWGRYVLKPRTEKSDVEVKLDRIEKKIDKSSKHQNLKWYIGLGVAVVLAIIGLLII